MTSHDAAPLTQRFEQDRPRLQAMAYRMLGSQPEAEDAVQEAWLRLSRSDADQVANLSGWLTTVVSRICLDQLRSRGTRREAVLGDELTASLPAPRSDGGDPEHEAVLADSVGGALLVVLDALSPAERVAFVLHDLFAVPFDEVATVLGRSGDAAKQLASRARRRVRGAPGVERNPDRQRKVVAAFLAASRNGDFAGLLALLHPDAMLRADAAAVLAGAAAEVRGAAAVAETFSGRAQAARLALIDGAAGAAWLVGGQLKVVFNFTVVDGTVTAIELLADPAVLDELDVELLPSAR
ncbi:sigma-70 family RNA polymerase sigma factor [Jatrophihabitans lederbergiae]|uniref:Sigma-70 family RNA polymerase sigma factor n=1 Tax=Jatrophihabitans lederbergiae TaxID=3075547 RepID=A0ABU2JEB0_9ACTN|nr:sigma-70 family RNA polymerase sigma factor [Jatrophihabitans sp. DSM 44399]MDT0263335.1 sigma-70 family RNA polymerase sigma factor [Jatrophihabitans sp. DSM 44399]